MNAITPYFSDISISTDPISGLPRNLDITIFTIIEGELHLHCRVYYLDENGERIITQRLRGYDRLLRATNQSRLGQTGSLETQKEIIDIINEVEVPRLETIEELYARTIGEFDFYMSNMTVPTVIRDLLLQSVAISDERKLFNI